MPMLTKFVLFLVGFFIVTGNTYAETADQLWSQVVEKNASLKRNSTFVPIFSELRRLYSQPSIDPKKICKIAKVSKPLQEPFINWWKGCERDSKVILTPESDFDAIDRKIEAYTKPFLNAISVQATQSDIPFLIFIEDIRELRHWSLGNSYQIVPKVIKKYTDENVLGLLLYSVEDDNSLSIDARHRLIDVIGDVGNPIVLPTLVKNAFGRAYVYTPDDRVIKAIHNVDPLHIIIKQYFNYCERFTRNDYVPAETKRARILKKKLDSFVKGR